METLASRPYLRNNGDKQIVLCQTPRWYSTTFRPDLLYYYFVLRRNHTAMSSNIVNHTWTFILNDSKQRVVAKLMQRLCVFSELHEDSFQLASVSRPFARHCPHRRHRLHPANPF